MKKFIIFSILSAFSRSVVAGQPTQKVVPVKTELQLIAIDPADGGARKVIDAMKKSFPETTEVTFGTLQQIPTTSKVYAPSAALSTTSKFAHIQPALQATSSNPQSLPPDFINQINEILNSEAIFTALHLAVFNYASIDTIAENTLKIFQTGLLKGISFDKHDLYRVLVKEITAQLYSQKMRELSAGVLRKTFIEGRFAQQIFDDIAKARPDNRMQEVGKISQKVLRLLLDRNLIEALITHINYDSIIAEVLAYLKNQQATPLVRAQTQNISASTTQLDRGTSHLSSMQSSASSQSSTSQDVRRHRKVSTIRPTLQPVAFNASELALEQKRGIQRFLTLRIQSSSQLQSNDLDTLLLDKVNKLFEGEDLPLQLYSVLFNDEFVDHIARIVQEQVEKQLPGKGGHVLYKKLVSAITCMINSEEIKSYGVNLLWGQFTVDQLSAFMLNEASNSNVADWRELDQKIVQETLEMLFSQGILTGVINDVISRLNITALAEKSIT